MCTNICCSDNEQSLTSPLIFTLPGKKHLFVDREPTQPSFTGVYAVITFWDFYNDGIYEFPVPVSAWSQTLFTLLLLTRKLQEKIHRPAGMEKNIKKYCFVRLRSYLLQQTRYNYSYYDGVLGVHKTFPS